MSENPLSPDLPRLLSQVLLALEGLRRSSSPDESDWEEIEEELETFDRQQATLVHRSIRDEIQDSVHRARKAVEARDSDGVREALLEVGRSFDGWIRRSRGPQA